jgi:hypothetical protein
MTYAGIELCLHVRHVNIFLFFTSVILRKGFLFLSDIQKVYSELLQLTACDTNHCASNVWETVEAASPRDSSKSLEKLKNVIVK